MKKLSKNINSFVVASLIAAVVCMFFGCGRGIELSRLTVSEPAYLPMFGKTPARSFFYDMSLGDSLRLKWETSINGSFDNSAPVIMDDCIFIPDLSGRVFAFNIQDGKKLGEIRHKGVVNNSPVLHKLDLYYVLLQNRRPGSEIKKYNLKMGEERKELSVKGNILSEAIAASDGLYYSTETGEILKTDFELNRLWTFQSGSMIRSTPALSENIFVTGTSSGEIIALGSGQGNQIYRKKLDAPFEGGIAIEQNRIFAADTKGNLYCLSLNDGQVEWKAELKSKIITTPVLLNDRVVVSSLDGEVFAIGKTSGRTIWKTVTGGVLNATPAVFRDVVVQPDLNRKLYLMNTETGKIIKTLVFEERVRLSPVYYKNILIIGTDRGKVFAYESVR